MFAFLPYDHRNVGCLDASDGIVRVNFRNGRRTDLIQQRGRIRLHASDMEAAIEVECRLSLIEQRRLVKRFEIDGTVRRYGLVQIRPILDTVNSRLARQVRLSVLRYQRFGGADIEVQETRGQHVAISHRYG